MAQSPVETRHGGTDPLRRKRTGSRSGAHKRDATTVARQVGLFFRATREAQNLSQEQLAALTGRQSGRVSRAMISAVERGRHLPGLEILLTLSRVLHVSPTEVLERLELARGPEVDTTGLTFEELDRRAGRSFWAGDPRRAAACYDAMLRQLRDTPPADSRECRRKTATVEMRRGTALRRSGATTAARTSIERAITLADAMPDIQAQAYLVLAALLIQIGRLPLARDAARRGLELAVDVDDTKLMGWAWIEQGEVLAACDKPAEAREAFLQARKLVRAAGDVRHAIKVEGNLGYCLRELGRHAQARRRYLAAIVLARRNDVAAAESLWLVELGGLALESGDPDEADACAAAALRIARANEDWLTCFRAEWLRHRVHGERDPGAIDRHRIAHLKRLYVKLEEHQGIEEIRHFKRVYGASSSRSGGS